MPTQTALRIVLAHEGKSFRLESSTRIDKVVRPSDPLEWSKAEVGSWVLLEDGRGRPVFRRIVANPLDSHEVFTGDEREVERVGPGKNSAPVTFLVPQIEGARIMTLYAAETHGKKRPKVQLVFKIELKKLFARTTEGRHGHGRK